MGSLQGGLKQNSLLRNRQFSTISNRRSSSVTVPSLNKISGGNIENSACDRKKPKIWGKKSPKIQGGPQHDQFRNISSPMDPASHGTKIAPSPPLEAEKLGEKFLEKGGSPTPNFYAVGKISPSSMSPASLVILVREMGKCRRRR